MTKVVDRQVLMFSKSNTGQVQDLWKLKESLFLLYVYCFEVSGSILFLLGYPIGLNFLR